MCASQRPDIIQILLFLDDLLMFYQAFGMNLSLNMCGIFIAGWGLCVYWGLHLYKDTK